MSIQPGGGALKPETLAQIAGGLLIQQAVNGALDPTKGGTYLITKAGVAALTLAAPRVGLDDGVCIRLISTTANGHTLTATALLQTGSANVTVATFAANAGASLTLIAFNGLWFVVAQIQITFT